MLRTCAFILALLVMLSTGCASKPAGVFGVSQEQWEQLTPEQKTLVIEGYNQRKQRQAEMAPYRDAVRALETGILLH